MRTRIFSCFKIRTEFFEGNELNPTFSYPLIRRKCVDNQIKSCVPKTKHNIWGILSTGNSKLYRINDWCCLFLYDDLVFFIRFLCSFCHLPQLSIRDCEQRTFTLRGRGNSFPVWGSVSDDVSLLFFFLTKKQHLGFACEAKNKFRGAECCDTL